ncbi:unnamed protein product [Psylliodes chrysocephalus]|uniref:Pre-rRNA-processing protein RIX1 N-terminal domain-containing protein n=1 Tax=Psylliodes chrysocephalus TaxID=3402493 RepID=A0A9P0GM48_9CUCU|nr:unnamed protein product [Psylliodes chrysocephala]
MVSAISNDNSTPSEFDPDMFNLYLLNGPTEANLRALNKLLSTPKTSRKGLELLNSLLNYCTIDMISDYIILWLDFCLKESSENFTESKLLLISKLIKISYNNNDVSKKIVSDCLSKIVDLCLKQSNNSYEVLAALDVLAVSMKRFGSWFPSHKLQIETYIISFLENSSAAIVEKAAAAFLLLQQVGNAGNEGVHHRKNFQESLQKLCKTFHDLLDQFFENRVDISHIDSIDIPNHEGFHFDNQLFDTQIMITVTAQRIKNILIFITVMIKNGFPVCKDIRPMDILNVISRGTVPHHCVSTATDNSKEDYQFCSNLNSIQVQLIRLLRIFIIWLKNHSFPFAFIISKILMDCLKKSQNCKCFDLDVYYQETIYLTLKCWISTSRSALNSYFQEQLIACILKDISPLKTSVSLKIQAVTKKKGTIQRNITEHNSMPSRQGNHSIVDKGEHMKEREEIRCQLALNTLTTLFQSGFIQLETRTTQNIYTLIFTIFNDIITSEIPHPYRNHKCQLNLLKLLVAFYEQDTLKNLPPVSLSINILNIYSSNSNSDIATVCKRGLNILEKICQPVSVPLNTSSFLTDVMQSNHSTSQESNFMECVADLTLVSTDESKDDDKKLNHKNEITILDNRLLHMDLVQISSSAENESAGPLSTNSVIVGDSSNKSSESYQNKLINESNDISESQHEAVNISDDEPLVKMPRIISEDDEVNIKEISKSEIKDSEFQELNSAFVDEVKDEANLIEISKSDIKDSEFQELNSAFVDEVKEY